MAQLLLSLNVINYNKYREAFEKVLGKIVQGETISNSFRSNRFLSATDYGIILAGEQSRGLATSFVKIAEI
jgi:type II secretory pathway component PulF